MLPGVILFVLPQVAVTPHEGVVEEEELNEQNELAKPEFLQCAPTDTLQSLSLQQATPFSPATQDALCA
jgi:hypothetical protein